MVGLLKYVIRDVKRGIKCVVISQFVGFLEILSGMLTKHNLPHRIMQGTQSAKARQEVLAWFRCSEPDAPLELPEEDEVSDVEGAGETPGNV